MEETKASKRQFWIGLIVGIMVMLVIGLIAIVFVIRHYQGTDKAQIATPATEILDSATVFKLNEIEKTFNKESILDLDADAIRRAVIDGYIKGTGDKYAQYYSQEEIANTMGNYGGTFYGVGASLILTEQGYPRVEKVYADSPAEKGGLRTGDILGKVDGQDVYGMSLDDIVELIRGDKGTEVTVTVLRDDNELYEITMVRDTINVEVVTYEMEPGDVGYIYISQWYMTTPDQFAEAMADLRSQGMKGLIIDLRTNTGGLLDSVVAVAKQVLPEGLVVYTERSDGSGEKYYSDGKSEIDIPVVILTNGYTASASEIFTGAMKDHGKAISMGTKTYGKGVVQTFFYFDDGTAMKLTNEQYFTPNGTAIDGVGIEPDIEVPFDSDAYYNADEPFDNQLDAALQYLYEKLGIELEDAA